MGIEYLLNQTCTIQRVTITHHATTRQRVKSWANFATGVPCRRDMTKGGEVRAPTEIYSKTTDIFFMSYRTDLTEKDRIVLGGVNYNILRIFPAGGGATPSHLEIWTEVIT